MSMFSRTRTIARRNRRRYSGNPRRGSAPVVLQPSSPSAQSLSRSYLTPQHSPAKSISFSFEERNGRLSVQAETLSVRAHSLAPFEKHYESVVTWQESFDREPSFNILSGLMEARKEKVSVCEFLYRAFSILCGTWPVMLIVVILLAMPMSMFILGVKYLDDCPREPKLPIYLLVGGIFGTIKVTMLLWRQLQRLKGDDDDGIRDDGNLSTMGNVASTALTVFLFVWFAFGNYWLFRMGRPNYRPLLHEPRNWCEKTVHTFIFWQLVVCYVLLGSAFLFGVIFVCCFVCLKFTKSGSKG